MYLGACACECDELFPQLCGLLLQRHELGLLAVCELTEKLRAKLLLEGLACLTEGALAGLKLGKASALITTKKVTGGQLQREKDRQQGRRAFCSSVDVSVWISPLSVLMRRASCSCVSR